MSEVNQSGPVRRKFSAEEKFKIIKEQLTTRTPVTEICKKYGIASSAFYNWQEQFFTGALSGFQSKRGPKSDPSQPDPEKLEMKTEISRMHSVIAEISAENVAFKKKNFPYLR